MSGTKRKTVPGPARRSSERTESSGEKRQLDQIEITVNGVRIPLSQELEVAVQRAWKGMFQTPPKEMTTTQAAQFLDVSRPFVIKLIRGGELPCRMVGTHRRIASEALLKYREQMFHQAQQAADEMVQLAQDAGLYQEDGSSKAQ
jgi:excisionase family DNA binding protein